MALKTLGLAAALHQCGLRPPADELSLPIFDRILVDIGDDQSIAMSLSTFSGHVRSLVAILEAATDRSLVLLDEVAAGTDPVEGAALAQALLERLAGQARLTVATSHFAELKEWAAATADAANAATGFDPDTDEPLFRVELGRPGTSHALRIAERLGLPAGVVGAAERASPPIACGSPSSSRRPRRPSVMRQRRGQALSRPRPWWPRSSTASRRRGVSSPPRSSACGCPRTPSASGPSRRCEQELAAARSELDELRREIRAARKAEQRRRTASTAGASRAERERDRLLGSASERSTRASQRARAGRHAAAPARRRSRWATPSWRRRWACAAPSPRSPATRQRCSDRAACGFASRSTVSAPTGTQRVAARAPAVRVPVLAPADAPVRAGSPRAHGAGVA